jgi:hypothetical protein
MIQGDTLLIDAPLIPDPDAMQELSAPDIEAIADEDLKGSRLLLVRRGVRSINVGGTPGGAVEFVCTFQPADGTRFVSARLVMHLVTPQGIKIVALAPSVKPDEAVKYTIDDKGKFSVSVKKVVEAGREQNVHTEYAFYNCAVQGSGTGTSLARWTFRENPARRDGLGPEQSLALSLPLVGSVHGTVSVSARLARPGLAGVIDAIRDLVLGPSPDERQYQIAFEIPEAQHVLIIGSFLLLSL